MSSQVLVVEGSTRDRSSTRMAAARFAAQRWNPTRMHLEVLKDYPLPLFADSRGGGDFVTSNHLEALLRRMIESEAIVLASPLYWYSVSHLMKNFLDHWSYFLRHPDIDFRGEMRGKPFYAVIVGSGPREKADPVFRALDLSIDYIGGHLVATEYSREQDLALFDFRRIGAQARVVESK